MPTTFRPLSASVLAISSPPTPRPRTMASTRSAMISVGLLRPGFHRIGHRLFEAHRVALGPHVRRFVVVEPLPAGTAFLLTKQAPEAGAAADLMRARRGPQPAGALEIAIGARQHGEIVELQNHPGPVPGGEEERNGFVPTRACTLDISEIERDQAEGVDGPAEAEPIVQLAVQRNGLFEHRHCVRVLLREEQGIAGPPEDPRDPGLVRSYETGEALQQTSAWPQRWLCGRPPSERPRCTVRWPARGRLRGCG